jgi:predicted cupin superfamily sugar epimerase
LTTADDIILRLNLQPHPEGGFFRETYRQPSEDGARGRLALISYLLPETHRSAWHRIDATEVWHFVSGASLCLTLFSADRGAREIVLGARLGAGEDPYAVVEPWTWMSASTLGAWTLVSCITTPAFDFSGFELAPPGWQPYA